MKHAIYRERRSAAAIITAAIVIYVLAAIGAAGAFASLKPQPFGAPSSTGVESRAGVASVRR